MFNNQKETDLQNFKTDESLIVFLNTTTDSAHLRCTGRLFHKTAAAASHSQSTAKLHGLILIWH